MLDTTTGVAVAAADLVVAASHAGRVVFLSDGRVRGELADPRPESVLDALKSYEA